MVKCLSSWLDQGLGRVRGSFEESRGLQDSGFRSFRV